MDEKEFGVLVMSMKAVYTKPEFLPDEHAVNVWYRLLRDLDYKTASLALQKHMMCSPFPPTIADIRSAAAEFTSAVNGTEELSELSAWSLVRRAVRNSSYNAESEYERLPDVIRIAVGSPDNLREMAAMPIETVESVEQSHFIRAYRAVKSREKELQKLSPAVRQFLDGTASQLKLGMETETDGLGEAWNGQAIPDNG